jgi:hypothetical protein
MQLINVLIINFFVVLGLELRGFTLSHSTSPIFVKGFSRSVLANYLPRLASNHNPPDLCLLSSKIVDVSHCCTDFFNEQTSKCVGKGRL